METLANIRKQLLNAHAAIERALKYVDRELVGEDNEAYKTTCSYCQKPIVVGDRIRRNVHDRCYQRARKKVLKGLVTWEELESQGKVGPEGTPGRPPLDADEIVQKAKLSIENDRRKKKGD